MDFSKAQIAALVLGYLKSEKLQTVVDEFLKCCPYFTENHQNIKMGKYFITRVSGMRLIDFLEEYAVIYSIVQGRLEETNYYEAHGRTSLVEQIMYLLEKGTGVATMTTSTPVSTPTTSEVDATPAHTLPGNNDENDSISKTPKKRPNKSKDKEMFDVSEVLTQTLLENHELHEKIAETINIVRNTPETSKTQEECTNGAAKELDALIKTVVQRTEEDPVYTKLLDDIIGNSPVDPDKKTSSNSSDESTKSKNDPIEDHNNDAVRSIIEASQNQDPPPVETSKENNGGGVYLFDGTLDTYLKTSGVAPTVTSNPFYINTGGYIVMPQEPPKQLYIVNNQPLLNVSVPPVKNVISETDIMSMPTIIVNDEKPKKSSKRIKPKAVTKPKERELLPARNRTKTTPSTTTAPSHVRNLNFSTPVNKTEAKKPDKEKCKAWDADLRDLVGSGHLGTVKCPSPEKKVENEKEKITLKTPIKDIIPKTPGGVALTGHAPSHLTPFTEVLEEQLRGVDLISLPTPKIPITPGFALTPNDQAPYNHRGTDYSTSSSYYQPSDSEQNKSIDQLLEECRQLDNKSPPHEDLSNLKILSDVLITQGKHRNTTLKNFNSNVIGKKNLNLLNNQMSESWSESSSDLDMMKDESNKTVISKDEVDKKKVDTAENISSIINEVEVKSTLIVEKKKNLLLSQLEEKRQRTVNKMKNLTKPKKTPIRNNRKSTKAPKTTKRKKKEEAESEEEAQKLVKGLAQRGIHLVPNKNLQKPKQTEELPPEWITFDKKTFTDCETVIHDEKKKKKTIEYDAKILKKSMSVKVYDEETEQEVPRIIKWTDFESIFELTPPRKKLDGSDDELMDYVFSGDCRGVSPDKTKGGRKRKLKNSQSEIKQTEKKSKSLQNNIKLLKNIDVEMFLDKVHGE